MPVLVQCAGQRDDSGTHLSYCSGHCCGTSIKQATYFKDQNPDIDTVVMYQDLRVPGMGEDFYRSAHRAVWEAMHAMAARGDGIDVGTVIAQLRAVGQESMFLPDGVASVVSALFDFVPDEALRHAVLVDNPRRLLGL